MASTLRVRLALPLAIALALVVAAALAVPTMATAATHTISGTVFGPEMNPVDACEVALYQFDSGSSQWVKVNWVTPLGGNYSFGAVADGTYRIGIEPPQPGTSPRWEYALPVYMNGSKTVTGSVDLVLTTDVVLPWALVRNPAASGAVVATQTGAPIEGVSVTLYWISGPDATETYSDSTLTDASGQYTVYMPDLGGFRIGFAKNGWATRYLGDSYRYEGAEWRGVGPWVMDPTVLEPGVEFRVLKARSPFGTVLPAAWTNPTGGLPYAVELYRRTLPIGEGADDWELYYARPAGARAPWPNFLAPGAYRVRCVPKAGTYQPVWHVDASDVSAAQPVIAEPGQAIVVNANFLGFVKASTRIKASASSVRRGKTVRLTVTVRDASITGRASIAQPGARVRLQRSYNGRTWKTIGSTMRTGSAGTASRSVTITKTTYFRAVPVTSATLHGSASSKVKVRAR